MLPIFPNEHEFVIRSLSGGTDDFARRIVYTDLRSDVPPMFIREDTDVTPGQAQGVCTAY